MKMGKEILSELEGDNWAGSASGNVASQALSACLAESQFRGCAAQQTLRFWATILLGGHLFKIHWICRRRGGNCSSGGGGVGIKNPQQHFSNRADIKVVH
jgi:hypothetical protein